MGGHAGGRLLLRALVALLVAVVGVGPVLVPPAAAGSHAVEGGTGATAPKPKAPKPKVTKVKPAQGPTAGGTRVKVKGKNFTRVKKVTFGGTRGRIVSVKNPRKIIVIAPKHAAGVVPVRVRTKAGRSKVSRKARFRYVAGPATPAPVVTTLTPDTGPTAGGTTVQITGANLAGATAVSFGGTAASFEVQSASSIRAVSPAHAAGPVAVTVTTPGGTSPPRTFTYEGESPAPPVVTLVSPLVGPSTGGTAVTITGTGFTGATAVSFGGVAATSFTVDSSTSISATTPAHDPGLVAVSVTTPAGTSTVPGLFTYSPLPALPPVVVLVTPPTGSTAGGTEVTITGTGFSGATAVSIGGTPVTSFSVDSDLSISAVTPPHAVGLVGVSVTTPAGTSTVPGLFLYLL